MALQVPGSPLRPYRSTSGFSGPCRCTCWCKTRRNCISQSHIWKLAYPLRTLHLPLMELLQCQFWDGWGLSTPPSWDTTLWCIQNQAEISRSCLKQKPMQCGNVALGSCEPNDLVNLVPANSWICTFSKLLAFQASFLASLSLTWNALQGQQPRHLNATSPSLALHYWHLLTKRHSKGTSAWQKDTQSL